jgi:hypothetical protein
MILLGPHKHRNPGEAEPNSARFLHREQKESFPMADVFGIADILKSHLLQVYRMAAVCCRTLYNPKLHPAVE